VCSFNACPPKTSAAHLMKQENDRWLLTVVGGGGHYPPTDAESIVSFLRALRSPLITEMLPLFEPTSPIAANRLFKNRWRHYEKLEGESHGLHRAGRRRLRLQP
jgi:hypothetical protein